MISGMQRHFCLTSLSYPYTCLDRYDFCVLVQYQFLQNEIIDHKMFCPKICVGHNDSSFTCSENLSSDEFELKGYKAVAKRVSDLSLSWCVIVNEMALPTSESEPLNDIASESGQIADFVCVQDHKIMMFLS